MPFAPTPDTDAFYAQPSPFPKVAPGTILASRSEEFAPEEGVALTNTAYEVKFASRDTNGNPIAAVTTIVFPQTPAATTPQPLAVIALAEDGLGAACAPSHNITGSTVNSSGIAEGAALSLQGLAYGWILDYPDYEGPQSAYASGPLNGYITLDSIRAAENFAPAGLNAKTPVGIYGYSGGGFAAAWSATLENAYAPELNVVGITSGGTPANVKTVIENAQTDVVTNLSTFALIFSAFEGINRSYPTLWTPILNAAGVAAAQSLANGCGGATTNGAAKPSGTYSDYLTGTDPIDAPNAEAVYPLVTLPLAGQFPKTNVFVFHSQVDEIIPISEADAMVAGWCAAGSTIEYYRGATGEHVTFEADAGPLAYAFLESRFAGTTIVPPTSTTCN